MSNPRSFYTNQGNPWSNEEDDLLKKEYIDNQKDVSFCADLLMRTPGSISARLEKFGLIFRRTDARGYYSYIESDLYKEIVASKKKEKANKKQKEAKTQKEPTVFDEEKKEPSPKKTSKEKLDTLTADVNDLKKDVKEILRLINMIYEFESQ